MHPDPGFHHPLAAQTYRFLQQHPLVEHWAVVVITPHSRLTWAPPKRHTRAAQEWLAEGRQEGLQEGRQEGEATMTLRLLNRRCGPLSEVTTAQIQSLSMEQLESLADALLDFQGLTDLTSWLAANS